MLVIRAPCWLFSTRYMHTRRILRTSARSKQGLASNAQGFSNCAYVNPKDLVSLAEAPGSNVAVAAEKGLICAVGEAVFVVK